MPRQRNAEVRAGIYLELNYGRRTVSMSVALISPALDSVDAVHA